MTMSLEVKGLRKNLDGRKILQGVDLRVEAEEVCALVGPSGAGKTTLLRCISFLLPPDAGNVYYDEREAPDEPAGRLALRRRIVMVAQNPLLFRGTVFYNVSYGLCTRGVVDPELTERTTAALTAVGLAERADARASRLSAGEAQRVAFARAIVIRPELLLLDEFTANLDPANVAHLEHGIDAYHRDTAATILIVTHNLFQARRVATRAALLLSGGIIEASDVDAFFDHPTDERTRAFVRGDMPY